MKKIAVYALIITLLVVALVLTQTEVNNNYQTKEKDMLIELPQPRLKGETSLEEAVKERRSVRSYKEEPLSLEKVSQILWSAQGLTESDFRAAPSAGALYPLSVYVVFEEVDDVVPGVYKYIVEDHKLQMVKEGSFREEVYESALNQSSVKEAPFILIITADYSVTEARYGSRAERYVHMEAGHVGQNIYLQATVLNLGTVAIGAFSDDRIKDIINNEETPLYIFPIGKQL